MEAEAELENIEKELKSKLIEIMYQKHNIYAFFLNKGDTNG